MLIWEWLTDRLHCTTGLTNLKVIQENEDGDDDVLKVSLPLLLPKERK